MTVPPTPPTGAPEVAAAILAIEDYWSAMAQRWPWMLQQSMRPVYLLTGELLIALTRMFPGMVHSNQMRWYARETAGAPSIYVLPPDDFHQEAERRLGKSDPRLLDGKQAVTFLYLARQGGTEQVAKTLLVTTAQQQPFFRAQLAHELVNCACATDWDGHQLRAGMRLALWGGGFASQRGGLLNDLLIDTLLLDFLPTATSYTRDSLLTGQQGPYWNIAAALSQRLPRDFILGALFGPDADRLVLEGRLNEAFERGDAALWLDQLLDQRDWAGLATALGMDDRPAE